MGVSEAVPGEAGASGLLSQQTLAELVGHEALARAAVYVRTGRVHGVTVDPDTLSVTGRVGGTYRDSYDVSVQLASSATGATTVHRTRCSCPVVTDCKHVAAVLLVAGSLGAVRQVLQRPEWEKTLTGLLEATSREQDTNLAPLALEFGVEKVPAVRGYAGRQDLQIRPARRGRTGGWVRAGIGWDDLDFIARSYEPQQRELLLQFRAAAGASARFALPRSPWLSLSVVTSAFWSLLEQAAAAGLTILTAKPLAGPTTARPATISLDVRRAGTAGLLVGPRVEVDGASVPVATVGVLGEPAHGVFWVDRSAPEAEEIRIAPLEALLSRELRQLVVDARTLHVPAHDEARFLADFATPLRQRLALRSQDASVPLPELVPPRLALAVDFRPEHRLRLDWQVVYAGPDGDRRFDLDESSVGVSVRSPETEQRLLAGLPLPYADLPGLLDHGSVPSASGPSVPGPSIPAAHALLEGAAAVRFVSRVLPDLERTGVEVLRTGEVLDYRESTAAPRVEVEAVPRPALADWFDLRISVAVEGEAVPFEELFVALVQCEPYLITPAGVCFSLERPELHALRELIEESRALADPEQPELTISPAAVDRWQELVGLGAVVRESDQWRRAVQGLVDPGAMEPIAVPDGLRARLRPYQLTGFHWLHFLHQAGLGGILADDMGLGKTLQALALVCAVRQAGATGPPFLVVAPTSVVAGWSTEAARFAPHLQVVTVTQTRAKQGIPLAEVVAGADVVVSSYALVRLDADEYAEPSWAGVFLDEAQFVKNHRSRSYASVRRLRAAFKVAITGTPLENNLMDLWALLSVTAPGLFPHPERFAEYYRRPIERDRDQARLVQLRRRVAPLMLRRTKESVATDLPPKIEQVVEVELSARHARIYQTYLQRERQKVLGLLDDLDHHRLRVLRSLTLLRQLSLDAALVDEAYAEVGAAKTEVLLADLVELVAEGHQALVFSQFTSYLRRVRTRLDAAGIATTYLDGRTRNRNRPVQQFRDRSASVFLISLKAGGFGLNLTEADYCFVLDPWWNPATEAQAVDRAHRIGQRKPVHVYRLVAKGTVEEKVMQLKARKAELFTAVLGDEALAGGSLSVSDIRALLEPA